MSVDVELVAGPRLDREVAVRLFGLRQGTDYGWTEDAETGEVWTANLKPYSRDIGASWAVVERMMPEYAFVLQQADARHQWQAAFRRRNRWGGLLVEAGPSIIEYADTPALAICRAALAACGTATVPPEAP